MASALTAELHLHTAYSFGQGASLPEEHAVRAGELEYATVAVTDRDSLAAALEFTLAAKARGIRPVVGAELSLKGGGRVLLLVQGRRGYGNLCRLITLSHAADRTRPALDPAALEAHAEGLVCLTGGHRSDLAQRIQARDRPSAMDIARRYARWFGPGNFFLEVQSNLAPGDTQRNQALGDLAEATGVGLAATGDVHYHDPCRRRLQDALVAMHHNLPLDAAGRLRYPNGEFFLRPPDLLAQALGAYPQALENTRLLAERCSAFDLSRDLGYRLPHFQAEDGEPADAALARHCRRALDEKYPPGQPALRRRAEARLEEELRLISLHNLAGFLLVYRDLAQLIGEVSRRVRGERPRAQSVLPPVLGRGSSVSSVVCYLIGLSRVDPVATGLSLVRFLNEGLQSLPDIDMDLPRDIREETILRVYERYGRHHAALVAAISTYHLRGAVREVGKALGISPKEIDRIARLSHGGAARDIRAELDRDPERRRRLREPLWRHFIELVETLDGFPRHLGQHVGGMIISSTPLVEMVPVMPSAIQGRSICQWDKDSCDDAGFAKIDFLSLGMLSATEDAVDLIAEGTGRVVDLGRIPFDDPQVYDLLCGADTIGTFQMGSRAQRQLIVQTRPRDLKELADQDALVRPGPGNGGGGPIYARRKHGLEPVEYDHPSLEPILASTYGVMVFQEQAIQSAMAIGGLSPAKADALRRALSRRRSHQAIASFWEEFLAGAQTQGIGEETARRVFDRIQGFSAYGYPQSHAMAFAQLAYQTAWLKRYHPAAFLCALLNNYPLGFYAPDMLIKDAQRHGVLVLSPDVNLSKGLCALESGGVRLGLSFVKGVGKVRGQAIEEAQRQGRFRWLGDLVRRVELPREALEDLIAIGACSAFGLARRELWWQLSLVVPGRRAGPRRQARTAGGPAAAACQPSLPLVLGQPPGLPGMSAWERMLADYRAMELSARYHPMALLRPSVSGRIASTHELGRVPDGTPVIVAGMVVARQQPENAKGFCFLTLHDEFGEVDVVVRPALYERRRAVVRTEPLVLVEGTLERGRGALTLVAEDVRRFEARAPSPVTDAVTPAGEESGGAQPLTTEDLRLVAPPSHSFGQGVAGARGV